MPANTLVVLCGPAACGKSTWASQHFLPTQVVSSDACRALIFDDPANQEVTQDAFELMHFIIEKRLKLGRLTVTDATNLKREHRRGWLQLAQRFHFITAAILFNVPIETCLERNAARTRKVPQEALREQYSLFEKTLRTIGREGFDQVYRLDETVESRSSVSITRRGGRIPAA